LLPSSSSGTEPHRSQLLFYFFLNSRGTNGIERWLCNSKRERDHWSGPGFSFPAGATLLPANNRSPGRPRDAKACTSLPGSPWTQALSEGSDPTLELTQ